MRQIKPNVFSIGAIDWDRRLFDELIPLPEGTTYNAYVVKGSDKVALLDTVDPAKNQTLMGNLVSLGIDKIDYIVAHHAEQDHSGSIPDVLMLYPGAKVVTNAKCRSMLIDLLHIEEDRFLVVEDNATLPLGGKTLRFLNTPWVHWPETMCTYLEEDKILFSCDFFGAHLAESNLFVAEEPLVLEAAKRYYAEIMMPFRPAIRKNLEKVDALDIEIIAPSHGPVYDNPRLIVDAYKDWVSDNVKNEVVLAYVSMHESTQKMAEHLTAALIERGITVQLFNLTVTDLGKLAIALVDAATVVLGSPTVLTGAHPKTAYAALVANALRPKTRFASIIGSFGWAGKMAEQLAGLIGNLKVEVIPPVVAKGHPKDEDFLALDKLADEILNRHKAIGIVT
ncbi:MAG: FprA family A-type flavoprotein [Sedimentisphaerales bacterium]|jgi:flavorubredoxin|nr:FprA family A-type flavoprotein [Sedimentisphaerales bacterium]NLZ05504.1 FprA family A-type flavoprotein [Phycisphaerae bacterium]HNY77736.1 FprA family A-type flavoprotein [Sedimentisphaerales bacterium]HOC63480.1 FprA family A-type flavoprotein [Sedimentisphaerales bacterium]HOH63911.1 FprA family A-type flavoprotein [Sedimentisphaerales bacterium]